MPDKPPYFQQTTPYSCVPACLRMVLGHLKIEKTEEELQNLCQCDETGTSYKNAVNAAKELGFIETRYCNPTLEQLKEFIEEGLLPIVYLGLKKEPQGLIEPHAVVVIGMNNNEIQMLDPLWGEVTRSKQEFEAEWSFRRRLTILVK